MPIVSDKWAPQAERYSWDPSVEIVRPAFLREPPSLTKICIGVLARRPRLLLHESLESISGRMAVNLWQTMRELGRDSLETWLLFVSTHERSIAEAHSIYTCFIGDSQVSAIPAMLNGMMRVNLPDRLTSGLTAALDVVLTAELMLAFTNLANVRTLDLRQGRWPSDRNEIDRFFKILNQSVRFGSLKSLTCIRFPRKGPVYLKEKLRVKWPRTITFIQTPIKPIDARVNWSSTKLTDDDALVDGCRVEFFLRSNSSPYERSLYKDHCYIRNSSAR